MIVENAPKPLRTLPHWVCWRYETAKGRQTKMLYNPNVPYERARSNDPSTWATFDAAIECVRDSDRFEGVAFAFSEGDPYAGVDLDDCLDPSTRMFTWGKEIVDAFASYTEISPSERGVKIFIRGERPATARNIVKNVGPEKAGALEVYDRGRFFVVTGNVLPDNPRAIEDRQAELTELCKRQWPPEKAADPPRQNGEPAFAPELTVTSAPRMDNRFNRCLASMLRVSMVDNNDGSLRLFTVACRCVDHDLSDAEAIACLRAYAVQRPFPVSYSDAELIRRLRDAERSVVRGAALESPADVGELVRGLIGSAEEVPQYLSVGQMMERYPDLRPPVIHGLLREGETMNIIAPPKAGKSWLVTDLAMAVATGRHWLDSYKTERGNALILDNELHGETSANRLPLVAEARQIDLSEICDAMFVDNLRGSLRDVFNLRPYFASLEPGQFKVIVLDAFYRFMPSDTDENDNGAMAQVFNAIDSYARDLRAAFVLIHHTTKGSQAGKTVTDVGAGAGAQSRASDTHLVLREHAEQGVMVLDAAVRSWPPIEPICLRRQFPVWNPAPDLDPANLARSGGRRSQAKAEKAETPAKPTWTPRMFVEHFGSEEPKTQDQMILQGQEAGLSATKAKRLLSAAVGEKWLHRWTFGANQKVQLATKPQPVEPHEDTETTVPSPAS